MNSSECTLITSLYIYIFTLSAVTEKLNLISLYMSLNNQDTFRISVGPYIAFEFTKEDVHRAREHPLIFMYRPDHPLEVVTRYIVAGEVSDFMDGQPITENDILREIVRMPAKEVRRLVLLSYKAAYMIDGVEWFLVYTPLVFRPPRLLSEELRLQLQQYLRRDEE